MNHFTLQVPPAQAALDLHSQVRKQLELANHAVLEAVRTYTEFHEIAPEFVFGCDEGNIAHFTNASKAALQPTLSCGMPFFDIRIATDEFVRCLDGSLRTDVAFRVLADAFGPHAPITSLSDARTKPLCASQAILDVHPQARKKIEQASIAVLDAIRAYVEARDPMAPFVFGVPHRILKSLAEASRPKLLAILVTGIPIFRLREWTQLVAVDPVEDTDDAALRQLLKAFGSDLLAA